MSGGASRIEFLGPVPQEKVHELRLKAFAYVSASRFECCAYAVNETLALGCPTIVSSTYGPPEFVKPGEALLVSEIGDADQLAARIETLLDNPSFAREMGAEGRRALEDIFSPERVATEMARFYADACSGAAGRG